MLIKFIIFFNHQPNPIMSRHNKRHSVKIDVDPIGDNCFGLNYWATLHTTTSHVWMFFPSRYHSFTASDNVLEKPPIPSHPTQPHFPVRWNKNLTPPPLTFQSLVAYNIDFCQQPQQSIHPHPLLELGIYSVSAHWQWRARPGSRYDAGVRPFVVNLIVKLESFLSFIQVGPVCVAAVCRKPGEPLTIEEVTVDPPMPHEVRIRVICTSLCHSDITFWKMKVWWIWKNWMFSGGEVPNTLYLKCRILPRVFREFWVTRRSGKSSVSLLVSFLDDC